MGDAHLWLTTLAILSSSATFVVALMFKAEMSELKEWARENYAVGG